MTLAGPEQASAKAVAAVSNSLSGSLGKKLLLLLVSVILCVVGFVALDGAYSFLSRKSAAPTREELVGCMVNDALRDHAHRPDCSSIRAWGHVRYQLSVNSQGFRDKTVREVPPTGPRPRLLMLGDSFTESMGPWEASFVGRLAARFPQYEFFNGGVIGYSPSTYLTTARLALASALDFDEAIVFIDMSDVQDEAAVVHDVGRSGAVVFARSQAKPETWYSDPRMFISRHLALTNYVVEFVERNLVRFGCYYLRRGWEGNVFDVARSAWTYRQVDEYSPAELGFAPLGVEAGIEKEKEKMELLRHELAKHNIPLSVVVYPWPAQLVHDTVDSRQVQIWREWCHGRCKRFVTAFPEFFAAKQQCPKLAPGCWYEKNYTFGDIHFNAGGNAIVADVVSTVLEAEPPVKHAPSP